jgi:ferredoxin-like protein FixX
MNDTMKTLMEKREDTHNLLLKIDTAIRALQAVCPHNKMEYIGHDSHYNHERCVECGYVDDRC